jgi:excisionase family DNA binding protein
MLSALTIPEVAERFRVSPRTVVSWIASGELRAVDATRRPQSKKPRFRVTQAALDSFELARTPTTAPARLAGRKKQQTGVVAFY